MTVEPNAAADYMEAETPEPSYYYTDATRGALGPCQLAQLRVLWVSGIITRDTSIWREGLGSWLPVHAMTERQQFVDEPLLRPHAHLMQRKMITCKTIMITVSPTRQRLMRHLRKHGASGSCCG